jgi:hypothetical protein
MKDRFGLRTLDVFPSGFQMAGREGFHPARQSKGRQRGTG